MPSSLSSFPDRCIRVWCVFAILALTSCSQPGTESGSSQKTAERLFDEAMKLWELDSPEAGQQAIAKFTESLPFWTEAGDLAGKGQTHHRIGRAWSQSGDYRRALEHYGEALPLAIQGDDRVLEANLLNNSGSAHKRLGELREALDYYQRARNLWAELGNPGQEANTLNSLGLVNVDLGEVEVALEHYLKALTLSRKADDSHREANVLNSLAQAHLRLGKTVEAQDYITQALELGPADSLAAALNNQQAVIYKRLGEVRRALEYFLEALEINRRRGIPTEIAWVLENLGTVYVELGRADLAREHYREALEIYRQVDNIGKAAEVAAHLAWILLGEGEAELALGEISDVLAHSRRVENPQIKARVLLTLGVARLKAGRAEAAVQALNACRELSRETGDLNHEALSANYLGEAWFAHGEIDKAAGFVAIARELGQRAGDVTMEALALGLQARIEKKQGLLRLALASIEAALEITESQRGQVPNPSFQATFFARWRQDYEIYIDLLARLHKQEPGDGYDVAAFEASERARARSLLDLLQEKKLEVGKGMTPVLPTPPVLERVRQLLGAETALVEYALGGETALGFVVTREAVRSFRLPVSPNEIERLVKHLRHYLETPGRRDFVAFRRDAHDLYKYLMAPAAPEIAAKSHLVIVPDRSLHYLPFEVLLTREAELDAGWGDLLYLLDRWSVSYAPSAAVLSSLATRPMPAVSSSKSFLAFGNPVYPQSATVASSSGKALRLTELTESDREVRKIAELYPAEEVKVFLRREATEENVKLEGQLKDARRIHFATHGWLDAGWDGYHGLILTLDEDPQEDGFLEVDEVFNLDLAADLVVLSACETGLGREVTGEGLVGLTRAFLYAGAARVVVSLWKVDDSSTADLMVEFYGGLNRLERPAEALRQAKQRLVQSRRHAHPFYWAPFVLVGVSGSDIK